MSIRDDRNHTGSSSVRGVRVAGGHAAAHAHKDRPWHKHEQQNVVHAFTLRFVFLGARADTAESPDCESERQSTSTCPDPGVRYICRIGVSVVSGS